MSEPSGARLIRACEALRGELRRRIGLTSFTIELDRRTTPLVISLRGQEGPTPHDPRHDRRAPARIEVDVSDGERRVATVRIEDASRVEYPHEARVACQRIAAAYAPELRALIAASAV
jgi:hypothetical protein